MLDCRWLLIVIFKPIALSFDLTPGTVGELKQHTEMSEKIKTQAKRRRPRLWRLCICFAPKPLLADRVDVDK